MRQPISKLDGAPGSSEDEELDEDSSRGPANEAQEVSVEALDIDAPLGTPVHGAEALDDPVRAPAHTRLGLSPLLLPALPTAA